jgi:hypothetical protein
MITEVNKTVNFISSIFAIIKLIAMLAKSYFNLKSGLNSPDKLLFEITCAFVLLLIASEIKTEIGVSRGWLHIFSLSSTMILCLSASVPSIIAHHAAILNKNINVYSEYYLLLAIAVYCAVTLVEIALSMKKAENNVSETNTVDTI